MLFIKEEEEKKQNETENDEVTILSNEHNQQRQQPIRKQQQRSRLRNCASISCSSSRSSISSTITTTSSNSSSRRMIWRWEIVLILYALLGVLIVLDKNDVVFAAKEEEKDKENSGMLDSINKNNDNNKNKQEEVDVDEDEEESIVSSIDVSIPEYVEPPSITGSRKHRFPSVEQRVKLYMSNWYIAPCSNYIDGMIHYEFSNKSNNNNNDESISANRNHDWTSLWIQESRDITMSTIQTNNDSTSTNNDNNTKTVSMNNDQQQPRIYQINSTIEPDKTFYIDHGILLDCSIRGSTNPQYTNRIEFRTNMYMYCLDATNLLLPALYHHKMEIQNNNNNNKDTIHIQRREQEQEVEIEGEKKQVFDDTYNTNDEQDQHVIFMDQNNQLLLSSSSSTQLNDNHYPPVMMQFGDLKHSHVYRYMNIPHFKKFRSASINSTALEAVTSFLPSSSSSVGNEQQQNEEEVCYSGPRRILEAFHKDDMNNPYLQPIIWKLATRRHYRLVGNVLEYDMPWVNKTNKAIFSGQLTGSRDGFQKHLPDVDNCLNLRRCRLVFKHANSTLVDARLTHTRGRLPDSINGIQLVGESLTIDKLLQYKGIIMLEGNDVASGLKWSLLSNSVVLMPPPKYTSWAMEELLQPWVHYVPLSESLNDVEEKMQWVLDHDETARRIAERGSQWMQDLLFHPDAAEDDILVQEEIIRRYRKHFILRQVKEEE